MDIAVGFEVLIVDQSGFEVKCILAVFVEKRRGNGGE
jgi:hypothetical protein